VCDSKGLETACGNRKQQAAVTRQRIIKEAAAAFRKNGIAGTGLSYGGYRSVLHKNYCDVLKHKE
jgi:hypothetical protein